MQTVISRITFSFVDDAVALTTGFGRRAVDLTIGALAAARTRIMAPIDRLARACDVGGMIAGRDAAKMRFRSGGANREKTRTPRGRRHWFDVFGILATFRTLRELT